MPSLEILDMSRNKIKRLPSQPGSLTNLRVSTDPCVMKHVFSKPIIGILYSEE